MSDIASNPGQDSSSPPTPLKPYTTGLWGRSMHNAYGPFLRFLLRLLTSHISLDPETVQKIRNASKDSSLVYVMASASVVDYLLMNALALQLDLPLARFANQVSMHWFQPLPVAWEAMKQRVSSLFQPPALRTREEARQVTQALSQGEATLLFLKGPGRRTKYQRWNMLAWEEIIRAERREKFQAVLLPVAFIWGRRPARIRRDLTDLFFGDQEVPGFFRKLFLLRKYQELSVRFGQPTKIRAFLSETQAPRDDIYAKKLRRLMATYLFRERKAITGPPVRSRKRIVRKLLKDPELPKLVNSVASREKISSQQVWKRAHNILYEMIADYSQTHAAISYRIFVWLWNRLYDRLEVDQQGLERFKEISKEYPVVLIPSHKSHMDYLLLSGILYRNDMMPPHIAAGNNLSFWPMGPIFRGNGAFFMRRSISNDVLYAKLLALYVRWLIRVGHTQEFFIEGGRSRTGRLVFPKHGLLGLQVDAVLSNVVKDLYIIPIAITYEKILEEKSFYAELTGKPKEKEGLGALLRSRKLLRRKHGSAQVRFGKPISVREHFNVREGVEISVRDRKEKVTQLADNIIHSIALNTVVSTTALTATALLAQKDNQINYPTLGKRLEILSNFLKSENVLLSSKAQDNILYLEKVIHFFFKNQWLDLRYGDRMESIYAMRPDQRLFIDYYKNTVLHFFIPPAIAALTYKASSSSESEKALHFLFDIFAHEFFLDPATNPSTLLEQGLPWGGEAADPFQRKLFAGVLRNYLEAYEVTARWALEQGLTFPPRRPLIRKIMAFGDTLLQRQEITRPEALTVENIRGAAGFLHNQQLLKEPAALKDWHHQLQQILANSS